MRTLCPPACSASFEEAEEAGTGGAEAYGRQVETAGESQRAGGRADACAGPEERAQTKPQGKTDPFVHLLSLW